MAKWPLPSDLDERQSRDFSTYLDLLETWNARLDLTAAKTHKAVVELVLEDAIILARHVPKNAKVVDVGSGAGAPGLSLAILRPDLAMTLVEPLQKRVAFLRTVLGSIDRTDIALRPQRGEALERGAWDEAISRATFAPDAWLSLGIDLVVPGGRVWVLLAREAPPERRDLTVAIEERYGEGKARRAIAYKRR